MEYTNINRRVGHRAHEGPFLMEIGEWHESESELASVRVHKLPPFLLRMARTGVSSAKARL